MPIHTDKHFPTPDLQTRRNRHILSLTVPVPNNPTDPNPTQPSQPHTSHPFFPLPKTPKSQAKPITNTARTPTPPEGPWKQPWRPQSADQPLSQEMHDGAHGNVAIMKFATEHG